MLPPLIVCGAARNVGSAISASLAAVDRICAASVMGRSVIVTNDNDDTTALHLETWRSGGEGRTVHVVDGLLAAIPDRIDRLAFVRNIYLIDAARMTPRPELVVVVDLDEVAIEVDPVMIARAIDTAPPDWAGLFASQDGPYYDLLALRRQGWVTGDVWHDVGVATRWTRSFPVRAANLLCRRRLIPAIHRHAIRRIVWGRQYHLPANHGAIEVDSAFGGVGIYRRKALDGVWYGSRDRDGATECEHVVLHRQIRVRGAKLYISSALRLRPPSEHIGMGSGKPPPGGLLAK